MSRCDITTKMTKEFNALAPSITECYIAVGMITDKMFGFVRGKLNGCKEFKVIVGAHMPTTPKVMKQLQHDTKLGMIEASVYIDKYFHPKLYLFKVLDEWIAYVGSGNFTNGGWWENEELFVKIVDRNTIEELLAQFYKWQQTSEEINDRFIELYEKSYNFGEELDRQKKKMTKDLIDNLRSDFNIDNINFDIQFFKKAEVMAFAKEKTALNTPEVLTERRLARSKLYKLNDLLVPKMPKEWNVFPHYEPDHIASHVETEHHHEDNVRSLWVGYGRHKTQLKRYGNEATPLFYMRLQFILSYDKFGLWLMPGKIQGGKEDRENFLRKMQSDMYSYQFFELLTGLGEHYWIEIANDTRKANSFKNFDELREYLSKDNWRRYYFIIGRDYSIGSDELSINNIEKTCLKDFGKYFPMYEMICDRTFD